MNGLSVDLSVDLSVLPSLTVDFDVWNNEANLILDGRPAPLVAKISDSTSVSRYDCSVSRMLCPVSGVLCHRCVAECRDVD